MWTTIAVFVWLLVILGLYLGHLRDSVKHVPKLPPYIKFCERSGAVYADTSHPEWRKMILEKCDEIRRLR